MANHSISLNFTQTRLLYKHLSSKIVLTHKPPQQTPTSLPFKITSMAPTVSPSKTQPHTVFQMGLAAANHLLVGLSGFASDSKRKLRLSGFASHSKKKLRRWTACYGSGDHEPVIHLQNDMTMMIMNNGGVYEPYNGDSSMLLSGDQRRGPLWQKNILMGGKCQLPDFSGVILYDSDGLVVPPAKNSLPLLTWK